MKKSFEEKDWEFFLSHSKYTLDKHEAGMHLIQVYRLNENRKGYYLMSNHPDNFIIEDNGKTIEIYAKAAFDGYIVIQ